jgi:pimeloyl-ACP methyl ester carboxylesterase
VLGTARCGARAGAHPEHHPNSQGQRAALQPGQTSPYLELLKEKVLGVKIELLPGLGHFAQLEAPGRVNRLIAEFCR